MTEQTVTNGRIAVSIDERGVAEVLIDRPAKLNALTMEMVQQLESALTEIRTSDARAVVLRSAGDRAFSVGADIRQFSEFTPQQMWQTWIAEGHRVFTLLAELRQPTIAVVDGVAIGGGLELALCCDFRVAADSARFGLPETGLGTIPGWGGTERLTRIVGESRAKQLILARRQIDAPTALSWGLISEHHPSNTLDEAVEQLTADLLGGAPLAVQVSKQLVRAASLSAPSSTLEALASGYTAATADFAEGVTSFLNKTAPRFTGE
ncbi:enoyl-CoA hydratase [Subtercola sp. Z020]|uniref:enoyl-CoA hydratase/isomerase family protein n=1 Tax=Subtercola sp. Z020 TaxID=2080582 RepID=UPI000CE80A30|nr:enoyl-CoA hydratase/isomerase family protein [Subtercola sp. Z020]PPF77508.1 enoyl-CoA hydratase [Subtercola sp. Z020]